MCLVACSCVWPTTRVKKFPLGGRVSCRAASARELVLGGGWWGAWASRQGKLTGGGSVAFFFTTEDTEGHGEMQGSGGRVL